MRAVLRVLRGWLLLQVQRELVFRADTLVALAQSILFAVVMVLFFGVIFGRVQALAGWTQGEVYVLLGTFYLLQRLEDGLIRRGLMELPTWIERGTLDSLLTRPGPVPLFAALSQPRPDRWFGSVPVALLLILWGFRLGAPWGGALALPAYLVSVGLSLVLYGLLVFVLVCAAFWITRLYNLYGLLYDFLDLARYPEGIYRGVAGVLFRTVLPFAVLATFPARILMGRAAALPLLAYQILLVGMGLGVARFIWHLGLRRYESASR